MQRLFLVMSSPLLVLTFAADIQGPTLVAAASAMPVAQDAGARSIQVTGNSTQRTYTCHSTGDSVQVAGNSDVLHITGNCGSLQVTGHSNIITIDSVQAVQITGVGNEVFYRGNRPTLQDSGHGNSLARAGDQAGTVGGNRVSSETSGETSSTTVNGQSVGSMVANAMQAATAASAAAAGTANVVQGVQSTSTTLNIILSRQQTSQDCGNGKTVNINGYQNDITLTGSCGKVILNGWGNTIHIEEVAAIEIGGHTNTILWQRGRNVQKPVVQIDSGMDNSVRHAVSASQ